MTITIADGRGALWQWDTGRRVKITDGNGVKQVHYQNKCFGRSVDVDVGTDGTAIIPDELLQDWHPLTAYAYVTDDTGAYTMVQQDFAVHKRAKPSGYVYTPTEHAGFDRLRAEIGDLSALQTDAKGTLVAAINEAAASGGADWTQNNSEAKDYIKNRPEYLIDAPTFTCRLRVAEAGEEHYGIYSSESEDLPYDVKLWIAGMCYGTSVDDKKTLWMKMDGHWFKACIYYEHDYYNISYMKNGQEIFIQSWDYYGFLNSQWESINFNNFFDSVGIKEVIDPDFSFYAVEPCPAPSKTFTGYTDFTAYNVEYLVISNFLLFLFVLFILGLFIKENGFTHNFLCLSIIGQGLNIFDLFIVDLLWWRNTKRVRLRKMPEKELYQNPKKHIEAFIRAFIMYLLIALIDGYILTLL